MEKFSDLIKAHRKASGLTQDELAKIAGIGKTAVFDIEKGKSTVRYDTLIKVMNALNIKVKYESPLTR